MEQTERYLNAKEVMQALKVSRSTVYQLLNREDFPKAHIGRRIVVPESALREWVQRGGTRPSGACTGR